jgi:porphobilinogen synthase
MILKRPRRLRTSPSVRALLTETSLTSDHLIQPLFFSEKIHEKKSILSMPGQFQHTLADIPQLIQSLKASKIPGVLLFGIPKYKDSVGSESFNDSGYLQMAVKEFKKIAPELLIITDVCLCEYTDHGHCGLIKNKSIIDNDSTLEVLQKIALSHAKAGADWLAPSGMMDDAVGKIRQTLDQNSFTDKSILSYAVKYASSFYGPFREAAEGAPSFGDRKTHQMNPANSSEAILEARLDLEEGADILMVKPGGAYLDIVQKLRDNFPETPISAYQVSGEYAMLKAASERGWLDEKSAVLESLLAFRRAGAQFILTYYAIEAGTWLNA